MSDKEINLSSVHWAHGMLLTPEHFIRQEQYFDSALLWLARYATDAYGLVGIGLRGDVAERGAARHDPVLTIDDDGETLKLSVTQCRGISPLGDIIEIDPSNPLHGAFAKSQLGGASELGVYIVCPPHEKGVSNGFDDPANPQIKSGRRQVYRLQLEVNAAEAQHSLMIGRVNKTAGAVRYEKARDFIPMCTTLIGHSEMKRAWEQLRAQLLALAEQYTQLHRAMVEYLDMASARSIVTREDEETMRFVGRLVMTLENVLQEILSPAQSPSQFFQRLYHVARSAAVYLDLSPPTLQYFRELSEVGVLEFGALLDQEKQALLQSREFSIHDNLQQDVQQIEHAFARLQRLEEALEGKYMDYRLSTALENLTFFFDRRSTPPALYQSQARPARPQVFGNDLTFVFAPLNLDSRQTYRLVLIRENDATIEMGKTIEAEVQINAGVGQGFEPLYLQARCELPNQRNFAMDIEVPQSVHTISDLRVTINIAHPIKTCLLFGLLRIVRVKEPVQQVRPPATPATPPAPPPRASEVQPAPEVERPFKRIVSKPVILSPDESANAAPEWEPPVRRRKIDQS